MKKLELLDIWTYDQGGTSLPSTNLNDEDEWKVIPMGENNEFHSVFAIFIASKIKIPEISEEVRKFSEGMQSALNYHSNRGDEWKKMDKETLTKRLLEEVTELIVKLDSNLSNKELVDLFIKHLSASSRYGEANLLHDLNTEACDVGNIAMFIAENNKRESFRGSEVLA